MSGFTLSLVLPVVSKFSKLTLNMNLIDALFHLQIVGLQNELASHGGTDEKTRTEINAYKSRISELQSQITKLTNQVYPKIYSVSDHSSDSLG